MEKMTFALKMIAFRRWLLSCLAVLMASAGISQEEHHICYKSDTNDKLWISVRFVDEQAVSVKYKGSSGSIPLKPGKTLEPRTGQTTVETEYLEIYKGRQTGTYRLIHSGIWDYVVYKRGKDGRTFRFTIDHDSSVSDGAYRKTACF
jgi:hypothetical protein